MGLNAEIFTGERDASDVFALVATIAAVFSAIGAFGTNALTRYAGTLLSVAVACAALALMLL